MLMEVSFLLKFGTEVSAISQIYILEINICSRILSVVIEASMFSLESREPYLNKF